MQYLVLVTQPFDTSFNSSSCFIKIKRKKKRNPPATWTFLESECLGNSALELGSWQNNFSLIKTVFEDHYEIKWTIYREPTLVQLSGFKMFHKTSSTTQTYMTTLVKNLYTTNTYACKAILLCGKRIWIWLPMQNPRQSPSQQRGRKWWHQVCHATKYWVLEPMCFGWLNLDLECHIA